MSRLGGFFGVSEKYFNDNIKDFEYSNGSGVWNLESTTIFTKRQPLTKQQFESQLGAPFATYSQNSTIIFGAYNGAATIAVDFNAFSSSTSGLMWEMGGQQVGSGAYLEPNGVLYAMSGEGSPYQSASASFVSADVSPYYGQSGTFYFDVGVNKKTRIFGTSGNTVNLIATSSTINFFGTWGSGDGGFGTVNITPPALTAGVAQNYNSTMSQMRLYT